MSMAWRRADALRDAGIRRTYALSPLLAMIDSGEFKANRNTVLVLDEVSQIGPRPLLKLFELQAKTGMTIKMLGDREQAQAIEAGDSYPVQLEESARAVAEAAGVGDWTVAWQSAGRTEEEWLGPDVNAVIGGLRDRGRRAVVVCPIGFVSDHLEVLYDVDIEARATAERSGLAFGRTASLNDDPRFCDVLADVVLAAAG